MGLPGMTAVGAPHMPELTQRGFNTSLGMMAYGVVETVWGGYS